MVVKSVDLSWYCSEKETSHGHAISLPIARLEVVGPTIEDEDR